MAPTTQIATGIALADDADKIYELVDGQWEAKDMGSSRHSGVGTRLIIRLGGYVEAHQLGGVYGPDATFQIGQNERLPDVSFLSAARMPPEGETEEKWHLAPDLSVEVVASNESWGKVNRKLRECFTAGVRQTWLVSPDLREVHIYDSPKAITVLGEEDELVSEALLPGFRLRISELFQQPAYV
ncbi:MAG: Uma2 family endonuclease [Acidobacteria bacterium]|nr:Uma2 family endonuclease [Acidobacteriota bacterium]MBI3423299.1 Uma2 family endonuclease [Acidobacteriota bacterium]